MRKYSGNPSIVHVAERKAAGGSAILPSRYKTLDVVKIAMIRH